MDLEYLREYAKEGDAAIKVLDAYKATNYNKEKAYRDFSLDGGNSRRAIKALKKRAAKKTIAHGDGSKEAVEGPYHIKGRSILYDDAGNVKIQWVKTDLDKEQQAEMFSDFMDGICNSLQPAKPKKTLKGVKYDPNIMSGIFMGDTHLGMKAHGKETRHSNFDLKICSDNTKAAIDDLVDRAPQAETGLLCDVGDFTHANTSHNTTWSGTPLDVDTRHHSVMREAGQLMRYTVDKMLTKFKNVVVVIARGNHNSDAAVGVQLILEALFINEPRVNVLATEGFFHYVEWGKWLIGVNHGDKVKPAKLASVMARDMAQAWGRTTHRMWALGHFHHQDVLEVDGCIIQKFAALPPPDSWHSSMGFSSGQAMQMINFKKDGGRHSTFIYEIPKPELEADVRL